MEHLTHKMESIGIFVQFWWMDGDHNQVSGQAQAMANKAGKKQEAYVQELYGLLLPCVSTQRRSFGISTIRRRPEKGRQTFRRMIN